MCTNNRLNLNPKCKNCGNHLTNDEVERNMELDKIKPICFECINKLY